MSTVVLFEVTERVATITLNRPEARNALSSEVLTLLHTRMQEAEGRDDVDVVILTGADPAFCAGLDLKELGSTGSNLRTGDAHLAFRGITKPVVAAVNGVAVTGGFELALNCDFIVASERARFGDTHARVGVMPAWGLTVLLPQAIGVRRAREMSFTGNFLTAQDAYHWGLVNHVVEHGDLLAFTRRLAADIISNDQPGVRQIRATYAAVAATTAAEGWEIEARQSKAWQRQAFDPAEVERRRQGIVERGRAQR